MTTIWSIILNIDLRRSRCLKELRHIENPQPIGRKLIINVVLDPFILVLCGGLVCISGLPWNKMLCLSDREVTCSPAWAPVAAFKEEQPVLILSPVGRHDVVEVPSEEPIHNEVKEHETHDEPGGGR